MKLVQGKSTWVDNYLIWRSNIYMEEYANWLGSELKNIPLGCAGEM